MPQMLMITLKYLLIVGSLIDGIEVLVDITPSTFNIAYVLRGLSGVHWK